MTDEPENIVLVYLRRLDEKMDRLIGDMQDLKHHVTSLELQGAHVQREMGGVDMAHMSQRMDRMEGRLDRIEKRLDLIPAE